MLRLRIKRVHVNTLQVAWIYHIKIAYLIVLTFVDFWDSNWKKIEIQSQPLYFLGLHGIKLDSKKHLSAILFPSSNTQLKNPQR